MQVPFFGKVRRSVVGLVGLLFFVLIGGGAIALHFRNPRPKALEDIADYVVLVQEENLALRITSSGEVQPVQSVNLSPKTSGRLAALFVEQGDRVEQGQVIAQMESDELAAQRVQSQGSLAQAQARLAELKAGSRIEDIGRAEAGVRLREAQVLEAQSRLDLAREREDRNRALRNEGAISQDQLDEVVNEKRRAQASLEQAQAQLRDAQEGLDQVRVGPRPETIAQAIAQVQEAEGRLQLIEVQLRDARIQAPFSGIITQKYAELGAFVTPTTSASSVTSATSTAIVALAKDLEVLANVPEVDIGQIFVGQSVEVIADAFPDQVFQGEVKLVSPEAVKEQNVTSFQVRVALITGKEQLKSGMNVDLTFLGKQLLDARVVPTVAIVTREGETGVLIPDAENKPRFLKAVLGASIGDKTQVLQGLQVGDRVFVDLPPGQDLQKILSREENNPGELAPAQTRNKDLGDRPASEGGEAFPTD